MDTINRNSYPDVRARIRSQIYNRILKKPNPESYEMVSSVSGTSKSIGGGISAPERIKNLIVNREDGDQEVKESGSDDSRKTTEYKSDHQATPNVVQGFRDGGGGNDSLARPPENSNSINLSTLSKIIGSDRKKLHKSIFHYSMVFGEKFYDVETNQYRIPVEVAINLILGKRLVESGLARSYQDAFNRIKEEGVGAFEQEIENIRETIEKYLREIRKETQVELGARGEVKSEEREEREALAEALLEISSSIWERIDEIEKSILEFHYAFVKINQKIESVKEEVGRFERLVLDYLGRGSRSSAVAEDDSRT